MKILNILLISLLSVSSLFANQITINGNKFVFQNTAQVDEGSIEEYTIEGESLDNWTHLFAIRKFHNIESTKSYIMNMGSIYKESFPHMQFAYGQAGDSDEWWIDYITYKKKKMFMKKKDKFTEWDFFTARNNPKGGIIVYQYARREFHKKSPSESLAALDIPNLRTKMLPILIGNSFKTGKSQ